MSPRNSHETLSHPVDVNIDPTAEPKHLKVPQDSGVNSHVASGRSSVSGVDTLVDQEKQDNIVKEGAEPASPRDIHGIRWFLVVSCILASTFFFALDNTVVADIQPNIIEQFHSIDKLSWLSVAFIVSSCATIIPFGKLYSLFDAKWLYIIGTVIFEAGSALCGGAPNMTAMILGRVLCGVGGSGMYVGTMSILSMMTTENERPAYLGATGLTWGLGTVLGPVVGGAFADSSATWRWGFYINLCVAAVFAPVFLFIIPSIDPQKYTGENPSFMTRLKRFDFLGTVLLCGAMASGIMAITFGGTTYPWDSAREIALFVVSGVIFIIFGIQQGFAFGTTKKLRLFPVQFLRNKDIVVLFILMCCAGTVVFIPTFYLPLYFQFARGDSALKAAVRLLPFIIIMVFFCLFNGGMMGKFGWYMPWYLGGSIVMLIGSALMFTTDETTSIAKIYGYTVMMGAGVGSFIQLSFSVCQAKVSPHEIPDAVGFISLAQSGGVTLALAIGGAVFQSAALHSLSQILPTTPEEMVRGLIAGARSDLLQTLTAEQKMLAFRAIIEAINKDYILCIVAGSLGTVMACFLPFEKLFLAAPAAG